MAIHATIDLETLDTKPDCVILSLGAVKFDPLSKNEPHSELYWKLDVDHQTELGRGISDSTMEWWSKQDPKIMEEAFSEDDRTPLETVLKELSKWMNGVDVLWGQGYGFDMTILENLYWQMKMPVPWRFWQVRDSRTLFSLCEKDPRKSMQTDLHNALADALYQSKAIQLAYEELGVKK